jgi:hypothetical protein
VDRSGRSAGGVVDKSIQLVMLNFEPEIRRYESKQMLKALLTSALKNETKLHGTKRK